MNKLINTILVPVDFSENTGLAISKALEFCQKCNSSYTIHLFHVQRIAGEGFSYFFSHLVSGISKQQVSSQMKQSSDRLEELKLSIQYDRSDIEVVCWVSFGDSIQESIIKKAMQLTADIIIIGKHSHHTLFPFLNTVIPNKLAIATGIPVLTAKPGSLHQEIKTIVIPLDRQFPRSKIELL